MNISIVFPSYNEEKAIKASIPVVRELLSTIPEHNFTLIIANDGSVDNTEEVVKGMDGVELVSYTPNHGKGYAVRQGIARALELGADYIFFMDIDLSTDLAIMPEFIKALEDNDIVIGSRHDKKSNVVVKQPFKRRFVSFCSRLIIKMMFHFKKEVNDTQCGFKALSRRLAELVVERTIIDGFALDVEYLYIAKLHQMPYKSIPVTWRDDCDSRVKVFKSSVRFFKDLFKIKRNKKNYVK